MTFHTRRKHHTYVNKKAQHVHIFSPGDRPLNSFFTPASKSTSTPSKSQNILYSDFDVDDAHVAAVDVSGFDEELFAKNPDRDCCVFCFLYGL